MPKRPRNCAPVQAPDELAPGAGVLKPDGHAVQLGVPLDELPPAENIPLEHWVQRGPPKPGKQTA